MNKFDDHYPKARTGKECNKTECVRHVYYVAWQWGNSNLNFCMVCKHVHISQYKRKDN